MKCRSTSHGLEVTLLGSSSEHRLDVPVGLEKHILRPMMPGTTVAEARKKVEQSQVA